MSKHKCIRTLGLALLVTMSLVGTRAQASCGTFGIVKGDVKVESGSTHQQSPASTGGKICTGDTVISGKDSGAKILINADAPSGKNELNISPDTHLVLENYEFNPADNKKKVLLNILSGKVRATTTPNYYNDKSKDGQANTFEVRTKSAVAGVRGTDFMTSFSPATGKSELVTFSGRVLFGQPGPNGTILNAVAVVTGQQSAVSLGKNPLAPKAIPATEMKRMDRESKPETAAPAVGSGSSQGSSQGSSPGSPSADAGDKKKSDTSTGDRGVASVGATGSGIVDHADLGGGAVSTGLPGTIGGVKIPDLSTVTPLNPTAVTLPKCDFCTAAIQNTKSKVNVIIHFPGQ